MGNCYKVKELHHQFVNNGFNPLQTSDNFSGDCYIESSIHTANKFDSLIREELVIFEDSM